MKINSSRKNKTNYLNHKILNVQLFLTKYKKRKGTVGTVVSIKNLSCTLSPIL
jgi:hypothetical protein